MVRIRMDVVDVERRRRIHLPSGANRRVQRVGLDEIVRNHRAELPSANSGQVLVQRAAAEDRVGIGEVLQSGCDR